MIKNDSSTEQKIGYKLIDMITLPLNSNASNVNESLSESSKNVDYDNDKQAKSVMGNLISMIFPPDNYAPVNEEQRRTKNNILLLLLCLISYGIYSLFASFMDTIILAFITGIAYKEARDRFISFVFSDKSAPQRPKIQIIWPILLFIVLPWLRFWILNPYKAYYQISSLEIIISFFYSRSFAVKFLQILLALRVIYLLLGDKVNLLITWKKTYRSKLFFKWLFFVFFAIIGLAFIVMVPTIIIREVGSTGIAIYTQIEVSLGCQLISMNSSILPMCSDKISENNQVLRTFFEDFRNQNESISLCAHSLKNFQLNSIGSYIFEYEEQVCTWMYIIGQAKPYLLDKDSSLLATSGILFASIFGKVAYIVVTLSNCLFAVTTFFAVFSVTVYYFNPKDNVFIYLFHGYRGKLVEQIVHLIQGTFKIAFEHFLLSVCLLELFYFSSFNLLLSILLSLVAFVPIFKPSAFVLLFSIIKIFTGGKPIIALLLAGLYLVFSNRIYQSLYKRLYFHYIFTSMSVLFGIYQFGISGIFYGPIIIILFKYVHMELFVV